MGRWLKRLIISITLAAMSVTLIAGPIFATANNPTINEPNTSTTTPAESNQNTNNGNTNGTENKENAENTENKENTNDAKAKNENSANSTDEASTTETGEETTAEQPTCYDQVGVVGWLVCPGTGLLANFIDTAYDLLENLLKVDPIPNDPNSPIHIVWDYIRNITNLVFVIFFLAIIFSQLTGFGINNYGIKRMLPRLIVAAILINLSYNICTLAIDLSNLFGMSLRNIFQNIQGLAILNGSISEVATSTSTSALVSIVLGLGGASAAGLTLTLAGGFTGVFWLMLPVIFSGAIAVISAIITMAARQSLIFLLVMVAPFAFVCYLLPNTERWFRTWYQMFFRMIIFYPLFSVLFGASQLAGFLAITSATSWINVILGLAIQFLPLFMSIPLMSMTGTILGNVSNLVRRATAPAAGIINRRSMEGRMQARANQLSSTNNLPYNRLARWLEKRRSVREFDTQQTMINNKDTYMTYAATSMIKGKNRDKLTARGIHYEYLQARKMQNEIARTQFETDMDEGFGNKSSANRIPVISHMHNSRISKINDMFEQAVIDDHIAKTRQHSVARNNMESRADRIRNALSGEDQQANDRIREQITSAFRKTDEQGVKRAVNDVLADAISQKRRIDSEMKNNYLELYDDSPAGGYVTKQFIESLNTKDYNSASAAMTIMAKRGDHGDLIRTLVNNSHLISNDFAMQKAIADTGLGLKKDNLYIWAWAKANMIRRAMSEGNSDSDTSQNVASYIDMKTFLSGGPMAGDGSAASSKIQKASLQQIFNDLNGWSAVATQDRTVYKEMFKLIQEGIIPTPVNSANEETFPLLLPEKYIRSAAVSGLMDGEQLSTLNTLLTGGYIPGVAPQDQPEWFRNHHAMIEKQIMSYVNNMVANQLVSSKSSTIDSLNGALLAIHPDDVITKVTSDGNTIQVSSHLYDAFAKQRVALNKPSATNLRNSMNKKVREMFDIKLN